MFDPEDFAGRKGVCGWVVLVSFSNNAPFD